MSEITGLPQPCGTAPGFQKSVTATSALVAGLPKIWPWQLVSFWLFVKAVGGLIKFKGNENTLQLAVGGVANTVCCGHLWIPRPWTGPHSMAGVVVQNLSQGPGSKQAAHSKGSGDGLVTGLFAGLFAGLWAGLKGSTGYPPTETSLARPDWKPEGVGR